MSAQNQTPEHGPVVARRAATALASLVAIGAGLAATPGVAAADETTTSTTPSTSLLPTSTTTTAGTTTTPGSSTTTTTLLPDPTGTTTTSTTTPSTTTTPTTTTTTPTGTATTPATTTPTSTTPTVTTTTPTATNPVQTTPTPGTATTPQGQTTTVTGVKTVKHPKGKTHRQRSGKNRSRTDEKHRSRKARRRRHHHHKSHAGKAVRGKGRMHGKRKHSQTSTNVSTVPSGGTIFTPLTYSPTIGTSSWGGQVMTDPFTQAQMAQYAALVGSMTEPPRYLVKIYKAAARHFRLPWQVLAAINYVETDYGHDLRLSSAGAEGWMQFMPGTWAEYGMNVDAKFRPAYGIADPWQPRDAIFSAARYLVANGAPHNLPRAVFAYNHAGWYVQEVLSIAERITTYGLHVNGKVKRKIDAMRVTARLLNGMPYVWGGGHGGPWGFVQAGYDCSGFVSAVLHSAGYLKAPADTQSLPGDSAIKPGPGRYVTIYDRTDGGSLDQDHVIIDIDGQYWESGGGGISGADRVHRMWKMSPGYLRSFNLVMHPRGM